jgi:hypothetical protein
MKSHEDQILEMNIQVSESTFHFQTLINSLDTKDKSLAELKQEFQFQLKMLENKMTVFLSKLFDLSEMTFNTERSQSQNAAVVSVNKFEEAIMIASK